MLTEETTCLIVKSTEMGNFSLLNSGNMMHTSPYKLAVLKVFE